MLRNYLTIAIRTLFRQKGYSALNIIGLAIGMSACLLITSFLREDILWDSFHKNSDNIYRVSQSLNFSGVEPHSIAFTGYPIAETMKEDLPEVVDAVRYRPVYSKIFSNEDVRIMQRNIVYVDSTFLQIFSFPLLHGDASTVLSTPNSVVIKESVAKKYFGEEDPIGQTLLLEDQFEVIVTGILDKFPAQSHLYFDVLLPIAAITTHKPGEGTENWGNNTLASYIQLPDKNSLVTLEEKLPEFFLSHRDMTGVEYFLEPLSDIHLSSTNVKYAINYGQSSLKSVYTISIIALFLLLIAIINYMNLSTARSVRRAREVGMRKVVGANRWNIILQFLGESLILTIFAMTLAVITAKLVEPYFGELAGRAVVFDPFDGSFGTYSVISLTLITAIISGIYPAFVLSSFKPISVLKGSIESKSSGVWFRRGLVVLQFVTSITLIIGIGVIFRQMNYTKNKDLGYDKDHILGINVSDETFWDRYDDFRDRFLNIPGVINVSRANRTPMFGGGQTGVRIDGFDDDWLIAYYLCDENQIETMGMEMAEGRFFSKDFPTDVAQFDTSNSGALVVNQTAVRKLGWENPIGKEMAVWGKTFPIIGVVRDFHFATLNDDIEPLFFVNTHYEQHYLTIRFNNEDLPAFVENVEAIWDEIMPEVAFNHFFMNEFFNQHYSVELRLSTILKIFSVLTIFIACLGLVGLASYATLRRTKEISVRKVLGASVPQILTLVTKEFAILVVVANLISWPIAYYMMSKWLETFAYKLPIAWWIFPLAGIAALFIALISTAWQAWRAALTNPSQALRSE